jgi:hypothetical protein
VIFKDEHIVSPLSILKEEGFKPQLLETILRFSSIISGSSVERICGIDIPPDTTISVANKNNSKISMDQNKCTRLLVIILTEALKSKYQNFDSITVRTNSSSYNHHANDTSLTKILPKHL